MSLARRTTTLVWQIFVCIGLGSLASSLGHGQNSLPEYIQKSDGSDLGIKIVGTITNKKDISANVALIKETKRGRVKAVKNGHSILEQYRVVNVYKKFIVIKSGNTKYLVFQDKFANEFRASPRLATNVSNMDSYREKGFEREGGKIKISSTFRDKLIKEDLSKIMMQATAIPFKQGGEIVGFKILQIDRGSIYDKAGLRNRDVITRINGQDLNSVAGAISILQNLKSSKDEIKIDLKRGEQEMNFAIAVE